MLARNKLLALTTVAVGISGACACLGAVPETPAGWRSRVASRLLAVYDGVSALEPSGAKPRVNSGAGPGPALPHMDRDGRIQIDIHYDCTGTSPTGLAATGFSARTSVRLKTFCVIEGWVAPSGLPQLAVVPGVTRIEMPMYAIPRPPPGPAAGGVGHSREAARDKAAPQPAIDGNGVSIMRADQFVSQTNIGGRGVKVGVQSTGVASLSLIQGRGELPAVQVLGAHSALEAADEGTALLEEVHAVAPGASLAFCGPETFVEYVSCLDALLGAGATILVDDVEFVPLDLMSSDNSEAQAVEQVVTQNPDVTLFTAAGNANGSYWEGSYMPVTVASVGLAPLSCAASGTTRTDQYVEAFDGSGSQHLTVTASSFPIVLAWADPLGQSSSNFNLYWRNDADGTQGGCFSASSSSNPLLAETLSLPSGSYTLRIGTSDASLAGKLLKLWIGGDGLTFISDPTAGSIVVPQAFAAGVITVGAVNGADGIGDNIESFSSRGPLTLVFPTQRQLQAPMLVAPDGIRVDAAGTYFEAYLFPDGNFYGTSAAAPNAAAIAALLRGAFPQLTNSQLVSALQAGASALGPSVPDMTFGYGRLDAVGALTTLPAPTISAFQDMTLSAGSTSSPVEFTVTGTGKIHFAVASSATAVIPASIVGSGKAGVSISPSGCGTSTLTCTLAITPAYGGGSVVTLSALDGANRSAAATVHVTVNGPPAPPPPPPTSVETPSHGGGGAFVWWEIGVIGLFAARLRRRGPCVTISPERAGACSCGCRAGTTSSRALSATSGFRFATGAISSNSP